MRHFAIMVALIFMVSCGDPKNPGLYSFAIERESDTTDTSHADAIRLMNYSGIEVGSDATLGVVVNYGRAPTKNIEQVEYMAMNVWVVTRDRKSYKLLVYDKRSQVIDWWGLASKGFTSADGDTESGSLVISFKTTAPDRGYYYLSELMPHGHVVRNVFQKN